MSYYFECETCNKKEIFAEDTNDKNQIAKGKKQEYEIIICKPCIAKKVKLKGNYIII